MPIGDAFKQYLTKEIEAIMLNDAKTHANLENVDASVLKIAVISLAFENSKLIKLLQKRGQLIKTTQFEKMTKIEQKIN